MASGSTRRTYSARGADRSATQNAAVTRSRQYLRGIICAHRRDRMRMSPQSAISRSRGASVAYSDTSVPATAAMSAFGRP